MGLFNKFKKKSNVTRKPVAMFSDSWNYYFRKTTGEFDYSVRYDMGVETLSAEVKKQYPHMLQLNIPF